MNGINFIKYMGFDILQIDISNEVASSDEMIDVFKRFYVFIEKYRKKENLLVIYNIGSTILTKEWGSYWIPIMNDYYRKIEKIAIIYSSFEQLVFINLLLSKIKNESKIFNTYTEAVNWLAYGDK